MVCTLSASLSLIQTVLHKCHSCKYQPAYMQLSKKFIGLQDLCNTVIPSCQSSYIQGICITWHILPFRLTTSTFCFCYISSIQNSTFPASKYKYSCGATPARPVVQQIIKQLLKLAPPRCSAVQECRFKILFGSLSSQTFIVSTITDDLMMSRFCGLVQLMCFLNRM